MTVEYQLWVYFREGRGWVLVDFYPSTKSAWSAYDKTCQTDNVMVGRVVEVASSDRLAFTLIELLVVVAIVATLIGLMLPAIQRVREAANRAKCHHVLRQYVLACHGYESAHSSFPTQYLSDAGGWKYDVVPFVEGYSIGYGQLNLTCPSKVRAQGHPPSYGGFDYDQDGFFRKETNWANRRGNTAVSFTDGLSNTGAISEIWIGASGWALSHGPIGWDGFPNRWVSSQVRSSATPLGRDGCDAPAGNTPTSLGEYGPGCPLLLHAGFGSRHSALPVAWGDGSVRPVGYDVNPGVWKAHGTRAGGD